jgi:hypothetical protein
MTRPTTSEQKNSFPIRSTSGCRPRSKATWNAQASILSYLILIESGNVESSPLEGLVFFSDLS